MKRTIAILAALIIGLSSISAKDEGTKSMKLNLSNLKQVSEVETRFQSVNIEMCEVVGGDFWIPYDLMESKETTQATFNSLKRTITPINLYDSKLRTLASALGPMYIRVSGTWANSTYFQDNEEPKLRTAPEGYENVLTRGEWKGVIDFCKATDSKLVTSFAISDGIRDKEGNWTTAQIKPLINFTKSVGGEIYAAEMFNEPSHASHGNAPEGYDGEAYARDFVAFKNFVEKSAPKMKIIGPGSTGEGGIIPGGTISTDDIMTANSKPEFEVFTYHYYGWVSKRCMGNLTPENATTKEWLSKTELGLKYYEEARDKYAPNAPIWLTETAEAACGGNPWAATYLDCFRYLEQLGRLTKKNVQVVMHNTLCASEYALLEQDTYDPRPNYWAALLWNKLMGTKVYDAGKQTEGPDVFVHNLKNALKGYAVLVVNHENTEATIEIPAKAQQYLLTSAEDDLQTKKVNLNGKLLELTDGDKLPKIQGEKVDSGNITLPPYSILFLTFSK